MIRVFFQGGLGNQMFQYAAGRCLAEKLGVDLCLDASWYHYPIKRKFELKRFNVEAPVVRSKLSFLSHMVFKTPGFGWRYSQVFKGMPGHADMSFFSLPDGCFLIGHFQSEKYFKEIGSIIRNDFSFDHVSMTDETSTVMEQVQADNSVAIHVRRGDYLRIPHFNICTEDYYRRALGYMRDHVSSPRFFVFSDDPPWCRSVFRDEDCTVVDIAQSRDNPLNDMRLIGSCRHAIISNSTYAWWAAWLNSFEDRIVAAPEPWTGMDVDTGDVMCPGWIGIPVSAQRDGCRAE